MEKEIEGKIKDLVENLPTRHPREMQFRGKRLDNGEWLYGDLLTMHGEPYISGPKAGIGYDKARVLPQTVGQWTGFCDSDGKRIYEGDVLDNGYFYAPTIGADLCAVGWSEDGWECATAYGEACTLCTVLDMPTKIVGNIHDRKEGTE